MWRYWSNSFILFIISINEIRTRNVSVTWASSLFRHYWNRANNLEILLRFLFRNRCLIEIVLSSSRNSQQLFYIIRYKPSYRIHFLPSWFLRSPVSPIQLTIVERRVTIIDDKQWSDVCVLIGYQIDSLLSSFLLSVLPSLLSILTLFTYVMWCRPWRLVIDVWISLSVDFIPHPFHHWSHSK